MLLSRNTLFSLPLRRRKTVHEKVVLLNPMYSRPLSKTSDYFNTTCFHFGLVRHGFAQTHFDTGSLSRTIRTTTALSTFFSVSTCCSRAAQQKQKDAIARVNVQSHAKIPTFLNPQFLEPMVPRLAGRSSNPWGPTIRGFHHSGRNLVVLES